MNNIYTAWSIFDKVEQKKECECSDLKNARIYIEKLESRNRFYSRKMKKLEENHYDVYLKL